MTGDEPATCPDVPCHRLMTSWDRFQQTPATLTGGGGGVENGWMDVVKFKLIESFDGNGELGE